MTENTPQNGVCCIVAPPSNATAQQTPSDRATGHATNAQRISLKALAARHLSRNKPCNSRATEGEKSVQQTGEKSGHFVARVAGAFDAHQNPAFGLLEAAASRVYREVYRASESEVALAIDELRGYPHDSQAGLLRYFEGLLHTQREAQRSGNSAISQLPPELVHVALAVCKAYGDGEAAQAEMLADLAHYPSTQFPALIAHFRAKLAPVRCVDCAHSVIDAGIAQCRAGVESGLPTRGYWYTDPHVCPWYKSRDSPGAEK